MRICRFHLPGKGARLGAIVAEDVYDLTASGRPELGSLETLLRACDENAGPLGDWLGSCLEEFPRAGSFADLNRPPDPGRAHLLKPLDTQEVWAAGVTYQRSRVAREDESGGSGIYDRVYDAPRPELFFKATPSRTVGPFEAVRIRADAHWNVPEAELALVLSPQLKLIGYTVGNDMSSRDIEGENPLYLPQAKIHAACCAVGPCITLADEFETGQPAGIACTIRRGGAVVFRGESSTGLIKRPLAELIAYLGRDNIFPTGVALLTGTGIVPPDGFSLQAGDWVEIAIDRIGVLQNPVEQRRTEKGS